MNQYEKNKDRKPFQEQKSQAFRCGHCLALVVLNDYMGTKNRNHCNLCLWSKHVDDKKGDRNSACQSDMEPVGLTMKREGFSRWGELMLIHLCGGCNKISINRIAADDSSDEILQIFENSQNLDKEMFKMLENNNIHLLKQEDREEIKILLFGK